MQYKGSNFYPFPDVVAKFFSKCFPTASTSIFLIFRKQKEYQNEFLTYLQNAKLETNFYQGK